MNAPGCGLILVLLGILAPRTLAGQQSFPIGVEARVGAAIPIGEFAGSERGLAARAGPMVAVGAHAEITRTLGLSAAYQRISFRCSSCLAPLERSLLLHGVEGGVRLATALDLLGSGGQGWIRGSILNQTLGFSGLGERLDSERSFGFAGGAGLVVPVMAHLELVPSVGYLRVPTRFTFTGFPDRTLTVSAFTLEFGGAVRF